MRVQLLSLVGVLVLSFLVEKCRQLVGEEHSSRSWMERRCMLGGPLEEGLVRCGRTFVGAFIGGVLVGEEKIGWLGFVLGSQMGSWMGGSIALMSYDVGIGLQYLLHRMPFLS